MSLENINFGNQNQESVENYKKIENYIYLNTEKLGEGNFSEVYRGIDQVRSKNVAVKVVKFSSLTNKVAQQLLRNEVMILRQLNHPNVVKCFDVFTSKNHCYIITQFCNDGDLEKLLERKKYFQQKELYKIIYGVYNALVYLNELGIVHRDLKPANVLLSNGEPKIADFGFAVKSRLIFKDINIGSPIYMSPEGLINHQYGPKSEIWSFGVMIYELLHGYAPLSYCKDEASLKDTVKQPLRFRDGLSYDICKFIQCCMTIQSKNRPEIKQLSQLVFMSKLISMFEKTPLQKDLYSTGHTNELKMNNTLPFIAVVGTYQQGLAILQYCRLVHKTTQFCPSNILSQWLLDISQSLTRIRLTQGDPQSNKSLINTINDYYLKYQKEHTQSRINVNVQDVLLQCQRIKRTLICMRNALDTNQRMDQSHLSMLIGQTQLIWKCAQSKKIGLYAKMSQAGKYLQNVKNAKKTSKR